MYRNDYRFQNRFRVIGSLECKGPLHAGDGDVASFVERARHLGMEIPDETVAADPEYATTSTGVGKLPILPGTALKGVLLHWLERHGVERSAIERLFGKVEGGKAVFGGRAVFYDATLESSPPVEKGLRWWHPDRCTCLSPQVVIDPKTRTATPGLLYYTEFVPAGSVFRLEVAGQDWSDEDRNLLLFALHNAFSENPDSAQVGAGQASNWGRVVWSPTSVEVLGEAELKGWMAEPARHYSSAFVAVGDARGLEKAALDRWQAGPAGQTVDLDVVLRFEGAFLVNDPSQARKRDKERNKDGIAHATMRQVDGKYYLPSSSVRGALRAQARRIWQTCAWDQAGDLNRMEKEKDRTQSRRRGDQKRMAPVHRLFGASGWRSPLEIEDFDLVSKPNVNTQEFVAIDRFTGGVSEDRKFNAVRLYQPVFRGTLRVDVKRWTDAGVGGWGWLWLAFLLRDWMEGDITFGFGASKGYGACKAEIQVQGEGPEALLLAKLVRDFGTEFVYPELAEWERQWEEVLRQGVAA